MEKMLNLRLQRIHHQIKRSPQQLNLQRLSHTEIILKQKNTYAVEQLHFG
jgi:hypothetical protein